MLRELPIPSFFKEKNVSRIKRNYYTELSQKAKKWRKKHHVKPSAEDYERIALLLVDVQNTFCIPDFELYVAGKDGMGAVNDNRRLCRFMYKNLENITDIITTLDTHLQFQIFHPDFIVDENGNTPPLSQAVTAEEVRAGKWKINPALVGYLQRYGLEDPEKYLLYYTETLHGRNRSELTIWPYHAMLGGIGHCLVPAVEEAIFFHSAVRMSPAEIIMKGSNPLTENYSAVLPEVPMGDENYFARNLMVYDKIIIAGQAKSHCVRWTIEDILTEMSRQYEAPQIFVLEDCMSDIVIPGVADFTECSQEAYRSFAARGVNLVNSEQPMESWFADAACITGNAQAI